MYLLFAIIRGECQNIKILNKSSGLTTAWGLQLKLTKIFCFIIDINRGPEATVCQNYDTMVQLVETGTQDRMLGNKFRFAKPSSYRLENKREGQRNNAGLQF